MRLKPDFALRCRNQAYSENCIPYNLDGEMPERRIRMNVEKDDTEAIAARDARHVEDSKEIAELLNGYELLTEYQAGVV